MTLEALADSKSCYHCGLPVPPGFHCTAGVLGEYRLMCCIGCCAVAEMFEAQGLSEWYLRREEAMGSAAPAPSDVRESVEYLESPTLQEEFVECDDSGTASSSLLIEGLSCAACVWVIERHLLALEGVRRARVSLVSRRVKVEWDSQRLTLRDVILRLAEIGFASRPDRPNESLALERDENRSTLIRLGFAGLGAMNVMTYSVALYAGTFDGMSSGAIMLMRWMGLIVSTPVVLVSARPFFIAAWRQLKLRSPGMDIPVSLAIGGAYLVSCYATIGGVGEVYFDSVCMFTFFLSLGRYLEMRIRHRSLSLTRSMMDAKPLIARREGPEGERVIPAHALIVGDHFRVRPGEALPADGIVIDGRSAVEEALLTGEPWPRAIMTGDSVIAGSTNVESPLLVEATRVGSHTTLASIIALVEGAESERPPIALMADRVASIFVTGVLGVAVVNWLTWQALAPDRAIWTTLSVLVATCPCALSLATPTALAAATHALAKAGLVITSGRVLEGLATADRVIFDKTGTLTRGRPTVARIEAMQGRSESEVRRLAERMERDSEHPFAHAFRSEGLALRLVSEVGLDEIQSIPGFGVEGVLDGTRYRIGRPTWVVENDEGLTPPTGPESDVLAWILLANQEGPLAWFGFEDPIRVDASPAIEGLRSRDEKVALEMLSGDPSPSALRIADRLGLEVHISAATPQAKVERVHALQEAGERVVVVGDGVNDGPFLQAGDVSVAMGSGCDLSRLTADAVLMRNELTLIPRAMAWSGRLRRILYQNFAWAIAYNLVVLPLAVTGHLAPWLAALGMSTSSLVVVLNALRLNRLPDAV